MMPLPLPKSSHGANISSGDITVALAPDYVSSNILYASNLLPGGVWMLDTAGSQWVQMDANDTGNSIAVAANNVVYYNQLTKTRICPIIESQRTSCSAQHLEFCY